MAEHGKGGFLMRASRKLNRTKTKVLQNLGKAGKTTDETFDEYVHKLDKQQEVATKFQKELRNYIHCARAMSTASKSFLNVIQETYEAEWSDQQTVQDNMQTGQKILDHAEFTHEQCSELGKREIDRDVLVLSENLDTLELMWTNYLESLQEEVWEPTVKRMGYFPPIKAKISKRGRKLVDYDNAKHSLEVQQTAKKKEEAKIAKAQEEMNEARRIYEELNNDLHSELPEFYNSRITFYGSIFGSIFSAENIFHSELSRCSSVISDISDKLGKEYETFQYQPRSPLRYTMSEGGTSAELSNGNGQEAGNSGYDTQQSSSIESPPDSPTKSPSGKESDMAPEMGNDTEPTTREEKTDDNEFISEPEPVENHDEPLVNHSERSPDDSDDYNKEFNSSGTNPTSQENSPPSPTYVNITEARQDDKVVNVNVDFTEDDKDITEGDTDVAEGEKDITEGDKDVTEGHKTVEEVPDYPPPHPPTDPPPTESSEDKNEHDESEPDKPNVSDEPEPLIEKMEPLARSEPLTEEPRLVSTCINDTTEDDVYQIPKSNKPLDGSISGVLFEVRCTHPYAGEDADELSFDSGELIDVLPFPNPDDQDDGWLFGKRKSDGKMGVFPENFTKKL